MSIMDISLMHHVAIVLFFLWLLSYFNSCSAVAYVVPFIYLYLVHERYFMRLRKKLQYEERRQSSQRRVLSDSETVRWLNHAVEKIWPICMEQVASQKILRPIIPWFLEKYKPWTAKEAVVQYLYLGRNPPLFTEMRVHQCSDDDHLVLELGMNFVTADDMSAILAIKLRKRLGFGMWAKLHITGMHLEGKVLVGVKFLRKWPFLGRLRVCFAEPPYFQMTVKPIFTHGLDVTELPGIAGWLDKLLSTAFEQTLVEPNMLVVDIEKFASPQPENWFFVDEKEPIAYAKVEVVEASDVKPSDLNGLADPYVKGQLGPYRFRTMTQKKTLAPKWHEEFRIPICTWDSPNVLAIEVCDKDHFVDDTLGKCTVNVSDLRDGQRHDMWLPLQNIKTGSLHLAVTVLEDNARGNDNAQNAETLKEEDIRNSIVGESAEKGLLPSVSSDKSAKVPDNFEPIDIEGQETTGVWIHQPGSEVSQTWEPRKGKNRSLETVIYKEPKNSFERTTLTASGSPTNDSSSADENVNGKHPGNRVREGLRKIFHQSPKRDDQLGSVGEVFRPPPANLRAVNAKEVAVKFVVEDSLSGPSSGKASKEGSPSPEGSGPESSGKNMKGIAKSILKHAEKSASTLKHVISCKGSKKSRSDASEMTEQSICEESEFSNDESLSSVGTESMPHPMSLPCGIDDSCNTTKHAVLTNSSAQVDPSTDSDDQTERISIEGPEERDDDEMRSPGKHSSGLVEFPELKPSEGNLEGEKR